MKNKIKDYIDLIFKDAPDCARTMEMKEEMLANVCDRYDDLIRSGKTESAAYNISISGIGDISELVEGIRSEMGRQKETNVDYADDSSESKRIFTADEKAEIEKYRMRRGIMNSVAIALYILCWVPMVVISVLTEALGGNEDVGATMGVAVMMLMVAAATVLMIMKSYIKPLCLKGIKNSELDCDDDDDDEENKKTKRRKNPILSVISGVLWTVTVCVYLCVSFYTGAWHITWLIFLITTAIDNIIEAIFELCGKKYL